MPENYSNDSLDTAHDWLRRLRDPDDDMQVRRQFQQWLEQPGHREAFDRARVLEDGLNKIAERPAIQALRHRVNENLRNRAAPKGPQSGWLSRGRPWLHWLTGGGLATAALSVMLYVSIPDEPTYPEFMTKVGEVRSIVLEDNSELTLDTDSLVQVAYEDDKRVVRLRRGRALFDVAKDRARPFSVETDIGTVTAVGTVFAVRYDEQSFDVALTEGRVSVDGRPDENTSGDSIAMEAGEYVSYSPVTGIVKQEDVDLDQMMSWTSGRLVFRETPIRDVIAQLNTYSATEIHLHTSVDPELQVDAVLKIQNVEVALHALQKTLNLRLRRASAGGLELYSSSEG